MGINYATPLNVWQELTEPSKQAEQYMPLLFSYDKVRMRWDKEVIWDVKSSVCVWSPRSMPPANGGVNGALSSAVARISESQVISHAQVE